MAHSKFYNEISIAKVEREVEAVYNKGIALYFDNATITHPFACDGLIDTKVEKKLCKLIMEYKYDKELKNAVSRASVIVQVLFYLKRFEDNGLILPNVCLVGDIDECFVFHTNDIQKYLSANVDWSIAPSQAHLSNPDLVLEISKDEIINPFVFDINENFSFKDVADKIKDLAVNVKRLVNVTEHNIAVIYEYFCNNVIKDVKSISPNDLVAVFINAITDHSTCYVHPKKKNTLICGNIEVAINENAFNSFFAYFNKNYTPQEKSNFSKISDRLIEDTNRRNKGEFYTPTLFVDKAHRMIEAALGEDWKEKFVVWDNCCGTKNLTRDYSFEYLFCSTLEQGELDQCTDYNKNATSFQFDFLNDSLDKLPASLIEALKANKPIVFLLNPPYATACNMGTKDGDSKGKDATKTMISKLMVENKLGNASNNLYAQFLYRIIQIKNQFNLTNCHIALFCKPTYLTGIKFNKFRNIYLTNFAYDNGILFNAKEFADVSDAWGINFTLWHNGETTDKNYFLHTLVENVEGEIVECGEKIMYNVDGVKTAKDWQKEPIKGIKTVEKPTMSTAINVKAGKNSNTKIAENALGCYFNVGNNLMEQNYVAIFSSADSSNSNGISILPENFDRIMCNFAARKLVVGNWINDKDEYLAPNEAHPGYNEFVNDSLIYSLFHSSSNQSSLRNVEYKGKAWNIKNEFFFMARADIEAMANVANEHRNDDCYNDAHTDKDRYVYSKLQGIELSAEAQAVLNKAKEIVSKTFKYRVVFNAEHPEYQVNNWDAGFYQLKAICKEYCPELLKEFNELFKALADKMRPMVYTLGFLK